MLHALNAFKHKIINCIGIHMKISAPHLYLLIGLSCMVSCSAPLPQKAQEITTIKDGAILALMSCKELGFVTGEAGIWGGTAGFDYAMNEAKIKASSFTNANAILVTTSRMNPTAIVNAKVFDCSSNKQSIASQSINQDEPKEDINITIEKAKKCQNKGGVWLNNACIISIN